MAQEANAFGKAKGYADVGRVTGRPRYSLRSRVLWQASQLVLKIGIHSRGRNSSGMSSASKSAFTKPKFVATSSVFAGCNGYCFALIQHDAWQYGRYRKTTGKNTPGVDGIARLTPPQRMRMVGQLRTFSPSPAPIRRVYIPKASNPNERRPLGIPIMRDRANKPWSSWRSNQNGKPALNRTAMGLDRVAVPMTPSKPSSTISATNPSTSGGRH